MDKDTVPLHPRKKKVPLLRAMVTCGAVMMLYMTGLIAFAPLMSQLTRQRVAQLYYNDTNVTSNSDNFCEKNESDANNKISDEIQAKSADLLLYFSLSGNIISIFVNLVLGSYSDFLGRKILFAFPTAGAIVKGTTLCVVAGLQLPLEWFYLGYVLEGLTGGFTAYFLAVFSYTADVTVPGKSRTIMIATMEGTMAVSGSLGQLGLGYLVQDLGFLYAGIASTSFYVVGFICIFLFLPETMDSYAEKKWSPIPHVKKVLGFFFTRGSCRQRVLYIITVLVFYTGVIVNLARSTVETLYELDRPFCWSPVKIGYYGAIRLSSTVCFSILFLKIFQPCLRDMTIALIGMAFGVASFVVEGLAVNDWMLYLAPIIGLVSFNAVPVSRSTMSKMTSPKEQGALFSSLATVETICSLMSSAIYNSVYQATVSVYRGAVFLVMAGFLVITAALIVSFLCLTKDGVPMYDVTINVPGIQKSSDETDDNSDDSSHI